MSKQCTDKAALVKTRAHHLSSEQGFKRQLNEETSIAGPDQQDHSRAFALRLLTCAELKILVFKTLHNVMVKALVATCQISGDRETPKHFTKA